MFTHCSEYPSCEVCRTTKTTHAPHAKTDLTCALMESHFSLIRQEMVLKLSYRARWICLLDTELHHEKCRCGSSINACRGSCPHPKRRREPAQTIPRRSLQRVRNCTGRTTRIRDGKSCRKSKGRNGNSDGSEWPLAVVHWNVVATCGTCTTKWRVVRQPTKISVTCDGPFDPVRSKRQLQTISSAKDASRHVHRLCLTCGEDGRMTCS